MLRCNADTMPRVTDMPPSRASALPTATTSSPTMVASESPSVAGVRSDTPVTCSRARSFAVSLATRVAGKCWSDPSTETVIAVAPSITWALVRIWPSAVRTTPVPAPCPWAM